MTLKEHYWFFTSVISPDTCDKIIKLGLSKKLEIGSIGKFKEKNKLTKKELKELKQKRNSNIVFLNDKWLYDEILPFVHNANKSANWNFDFDWCESIQFTEYKKNQHYGWHADDFGIPMKSNDKNFDNKIRKISCIISLSDSNDYEGGDLQFDYRDYDPEIQKPSSSIVTCEQIKPRGSIVVFPSFLWHKVNPVTKGKRYSLVLWSIGPLYK